MQAIVWSKNNCGWCARVKELLQNQQVEFEERNISTGSWTREQLLEAVPTARTLPQVFLEGKYVGGFTEVKALFDEKS